MARFVRRVVAGLMVGGLAIAASCGVPNYSFTTGGPKKEGGADVSNQSDAADATSDVDSGNGCKTDADCANSKGTPVCNTTTGVCVECLSTDDKCPSGTYCTDKNKCAVGCKTNNDCKGAPPPGEAGPDGAGGAEGGLDAATEAGGAGQGGAGGLEAGSDTGAAGATSAGGAAGASGGAGAANAGAAGASDAGLDGEAGPATDGGGLTCDTTTHQCVGPCSNDSQCPVGQLCDAQSHACVLGCDATHGCPTGFDCCDSGSGGLCVNPLTDNDNCGGCNQACAPTGGTGQCVGGVCNIVSCDPGYQNCSGNSCDDINTDPGNCGSCGNSCTALPGASAACSGGKCVPGPCQTGYQDCDGNPNNGCENIANDVNNCGACGFVCALPNATPTCQSGVCQIASCNAGYTDCNGVAADGCEKNTDNDPLNCGTCGNQCSTAGGVASCANGACGIKSCTPPNKNCNGNPADGCEVNVNTDVNNCGACGTVCNLAHATASCNNGACAIAQCDAGYADCDGLASNGCETHIDGDVNNCGGCGLACSSNNGTPSCSLGACSITCTAGFADCDGDPSNGCEVNVNQNVDNCGTCGNVCSATGGVPNCQSGKCGISNCTAPFADCDANPANGCEVNTAGDVNNCGGCGKACFVANGTPACTGGTCNIASCNAGYADCDGAYQDGCEAALNTLINCGACGQQCVLPNANGTCATGTCQVGSCLSPYADCDGKPGNGCEVDTSNNVNNCGGCGLACNSTNGSAYCTNSQCGIICAAGYGNCNASASDGCETNLNNNVQDCGACGNVCSVQNGTPTCNGTTCGVLSCNAPYADCDKQYADGCEVDTATDVNNCGGCGQACNSNNGTPSCSGGACQITCTPGYGNCNGSAADGCEIDLQTDPLNCGSCGHVCSFPNGSGICVAGKCQLAACNTGYGNCDGNDTNGCETNLKTDPNNCNGCGNVCNLPNATASCSAGVCGIASCTAPYADCDGVASNGCEVDTSTSPANCGACGAVCNSTNGTATCTNSQCGITCNAGYADCDNNAANGCETNILSDVNNCNGCGNVCSASGGTPNCVNGTCGISSCQAGLGDCDGNPANGCETDLTSSATNCGSCGNACVVANGTGQCSNSTCSIASCNTGWGDCDGLYSTGCETNLHTNSNCSGCGFTCNLPNASTSCSTGTCAISSCNVPYADCDGQTNDGCEVNTDTSVTNCGGCGQACSTVNDVPSCTNGVCSIACNSGYADCDGLVSTGCETSINNNINDCGGCGVTCTAANGTPACVGSTCTISSCTAPYQDCNGLYNDGCETDTSSSISNCGTCGNVCNSTNGTASCTNSTCSIACNAGYGNCDGSLSNGCETNLNTDTSHCGTCSTVCSYAHASALCNSGTCALGGCNSGYADCNGIAADGCETSLNTVSNCGSCGVACTNANGTTTCSSGVCKPTCAAGYADCDGNPNNGCETSLHTDTNCGTCGSVCSYTNASASCSTGSCTMGTCNPGWGNCDGNASNGCETDINNSVSDCGSCGHVCSSTNGTASCSGGACGIQCNSGYGNCDGNVSNGCETNLSTNVNNCGTCGTACSFPHASASCYGGACQLGACDPGWGNCDGIASNGCETPLNTDTDCGSCGTTCALPNSSTSCSTGSCQISSCNAGFANCDGLSSNGCEVNINTDPNNCNACGTKCTCSNGTPSCTSGVCGCSGCVAPYADCDGNTSNGCETNTSSDVNNCGACGNVCSLANATPTCTSGSCQVLSCNAGWGNCDGVASNGCETNINSSVSNCGGCGNACNSTNGVASCSLGACSIVCNSGYGDCNNSVTDGCETSLSTTSNCGACGVTCTNTNGSTTCSGGSCSPTCNSGYGDCDGNPNNGCETSLTTTSNCGACGNTCNLAHATATCGAGGTCQIASCDAGYADCDGNPANGCETALDTTSNCGACGVSCTNANGSTSCTSGVCTPTCNSGYGDCDGNPDNGCETSLNTDVNHCGTCSTVCSYANASASCSGGSCVLGSCNSGWGNCDGTASNGCETALNTTSNCGSCGTTCTNANGTTTCSGGACSPTCAAGYADCDGNPNNGCETSLYTNSNCGSCGKVCSLAHATSTCSTGSCQISSCSAGYQDCNGVASDGCEVNTQTSTSNCGTCGNVCSSTNGTASCSLGACSITCNAGYADCDGVNSNGCEVDTNTDNNNCGSCGNVCASNETCMNGTCTATSCSSGTIDCDGQTSNGCECTTSTAPQYGTVGGCCGTGCQTQHDNGQGQNFYDCNPLGSPGDATTYSQTLAMEACTAYTGSQAECGLYTQGGQYKGDDVCSNGAAICICWAYTQTVAGHSYSSGSTTCTAVWPTDPAWQ